MICSQWKWSGAECKAYEEGRAVFGAPGVRQTLNDFYEDLLASVFVMMVKLEGRCKANAVFVGIRPWSSSDQAFANLDYENTTEIDSLRQSTYEGLMNMTGTSGIWPMGQSKVLRHDN
jgi:hypothetical protein